MCGIVGIVSGSAVASRICAALQLLEYRGYDSAGILVLQDGKFAVRKTLQRLEDLEFSLQTAPLVGSIGIGHTRWATHGAPKLENAHPLVNEDIGIVHNGIIENHNEIRAELLQAGYSFASNTDTEVVLHLLGLYSKRSATFLEAILLVVKQLKGSFALGIMSRQNPSHLFAVKHGSPLIVALGADRSGYIASDSLAISENCQEGVYLEDGQIAILEQDRYTIMDFAGRQITPKKTAIERYVSAELGGFIHFMLKEIHEQPQVIANMIDKSPQALDLSGIKRIVIIGCGSSFCAALVAKYWIEERNSIRVSVEVASEFSSKKLIDADSTDLFVFISQSGETADTLAALKRVLQAGGQTLSIVNVLSSSIARLTHHCILSEAGVEMAVAATKTFLAQLAALAHLAGVSIDRTLPKLIAETIQLEQKIFEVVKQGLVNAEKILFIGRGVGYPLALEGALKLKELSYIPSEGIAAGELKHGSIALIDSKTPVIAIAPEDHNFAKLAANIHEVKARGAIVILIASANSISSMHGVYDYCIQVPAVSSDYDIPFVYAPVLQLIAYSAAVIKGADVDKPRNLAKSVTVE